jgi:replicative DNA helicase
MSINAYQESIFFHYILDNQIFLNSSKSEFFQNQELRVLFDVAKEHAQRYKEPPSKDQMLELLRVKGLGEKYSNEQIDGLYNTKALLGQYDAEWLEQNVGPWIQVRNLDNVMRKAIAFMKTTKVSAENAGEVVEKIRHMLSTETAIDFGFNLGSDFFDAASHLQQRLARKPTGYHYLDLCLKGGWWKGSLIVFLSGPKSGKSLWLGNMALQSVKLGNNTAYVTFELQEEIVNMRIGSNLFSVPVDEYEDWAKDQDSLKQKIKSYKNSSVIPPGTLHVKEFGASTCSVNDLKTYLKKTEEVLGIKFENIFVDYINIMKNWRNPNTENTYMKIKQIAEDLRAMAMEEQWAVVTATQTNRCLSPDSIVYHREKGKIKLNDVNIGDFILGDEGYKKITNKWVLKNTKTYKIKTKSGKEIIASSNHVFPINNSIQQVFNIKVGDKIYIKNNI